MTTPLSFVFRLTSLLVLLFSLASAERVIEATALYTCMDNSKITADHFKVAFTPDNSTVKYNVNITAEISGYVQAEIVVYAYGFKIIEEKINPCTIDGVGLCPVVPGSNYVESTTKISDSIIHDIPGIAYTFPDIDANVVVRIQDDSGLIACIEADLSNRKTVNKVAVKWVTAIIAGIGLLTSAIISTMGSSYTSAHIAANSVSLFTYFQSTVVLAMCAVERLPPIASAWAQNIAWSVGLIKTTFMQKIFRWYVKSTGGEPTYNIFYPTIAILVQKRDSLIRLTNHSRYVLHSVARKLFATRSSIGIDRPPQTTDTLLVMRGISRVGYQANIEQTSIVLTAFTFFVLICLAVAICFFLFYLFTLAFAKNKWVYYKANWPTMLKGTILRLLFIACPSLLIFSMWEFIQRDSAAVIVLAVFFLTLSIGILGWSACKVFLIGRQSTKSHRTPAYLLFSDSNVLNRYGFLYVPYKASCYYFIIPVLGYYFIKSLFVAFAQDSGKTQALALFIIEIVYFVAICYYKPYMDRSTNIINIIIGVVMLINSFLFLFFSNLFGAPRAVSSVMGIIFFLLNAIFSLVLLVYTLITCTIVLMTRNPDSRYKPAADDRASFIRDQKEIPPEASELTALGAAVQADHEPNFLVGDNYQRARSSESTSSYELEDKIVNPGLRVDQQVASSSLDSSNSSYNNPFNENKGGRFNTPPQRDSLLEPPSITDSALGTTQSPQYAMTQTSTNNSYGNEPHRRSESSQSNLDPRLAEAKPEKKSKWKLFK